MKKFKMLIIATICIIVIIVLLLVLILAQNQSTKSEPDELDNTIEESGLYNFDSTVQPVTVRNNFYTVKTCIDKFYHAYSSLFSQEDNGYLLEGEAAEFAEQERQNYINSIYNMLDNEYIQYANITLDDLSTKLTEIGPEVSVEIENMYVSQQSVNTDIYFVYGNLIDNQTMQYTNFSLIVKLDRANKTFKILLEDYLKENFPNIAVGEEITTTMADQIENNQDNVYEYENISDETYVTDLFNYYQKNMLYNKNRAYTLLDEEYKNKKFATQDDFETYIESNLYRISTAKLDKYQKTNGDGYTQYVCIDQNGHYYIFKETSVMNYTVILDTYTVDLPEFTQEYESATNERKVLLNIQKFFAAINDGNYEYAYNKLDETFKANNFATLQEFENYAKSNFFEQNSLAAGNAEKQGDIYLYDITISDSSQENTQTITKTFVMQLKEGADFVMSFSV